MCNNAFCAREAPLFLMSSSTQSLLLMKYERAGVRSEKKKGTQSLARIMCKDFFFQLPIDMKDILIATCEDVDISFVTDFF